MNAHAHWHDVAVDGVFEKVDEGVRFHEAKAPEKAGAHGVARRIHARVVRWLRRHHAPRRRVVARPRGAGGDGGGAPWGGRVTRRARAGFITACLPHPDQRSADLTERK
ncbi:uncharacterized protein SOCEGT47_077170 [Sorangium cellulosum]|uniref:Uncharacterized protein n=1 Tax=Sorangium cellulosum TaxID=56 RepID=A0A4P2QCR1_SORCE|nr:uncharacterized protein SOCEGT47_077170 [Sorangium cellulosum]